MKEKKKIQAILIIAIIIFQILVIFGKKTQAAVREDYSTIRMNQYSGYNELIQKLKNEHPDWNFTMLYTGLNWNTVIANEMSGTKNVVPITQIGTEWARPNGTTIESGTWIQASEEAIRYYMDPRNMINEDYIFQFEDLSYNAKTQTIAGVQAIINDIAYMKGSKVTYVDTNGNTQTLNKNYAQVIMDAASASGISPYHLASRIKQEQGANVSVEDRPLISGTLDEYVGYYNYLNIGATGATTQSVIINGLNKAKNSGWTNPEISIREGARFIADSYINKGQETLYLQKFDVDDSGSLYSHQYMQNISAAMTESTSVKNSYYSLGALDAKINFVIPVYENMPVEVSQMPGYGEYVKVSEGAVNIRSVNDINNIIATVKKDDILMRIQRAETTYGNYLMDRVVVNSTEGYIVGDFIQNVSFSKNSIGRYRAKTSVNVRNSPTTNSKIIKTLIPGQIVEVNELSAWYNDGYYWSRITMSDGRQVYAVSSYFEPYTYTYTPLTDPMELTITQKYVQGEGKIVVNAVCNNGFSETKPTWTLSSDKKIYTKEYTENMDYETVFTDIYGNVKTGSIEIVFPQIIENYDSVNNKATISVVNQNGHQKVKPSWTLSADKKTYSKVYSENGEYSTVFIDINGNNMQILFEVTKVDDIAPIITISQEYSSSDNSVKVYAHSNEEFGETKPTWTLSGDKKTYFKEYNLNGTYTTAFSDKYGNSILKTFKVEQIKVEMSLENSYNEKTNEVEIRAISTIGFQNTKPTWTLSTDKKTYTKKYNTNGTYSTTFVLSDGSVEKPTFEVIDVDDQAPEIEITQEYNKENGTVLVKVVSNEELAEIKPTWTLENDRKTYIKLYSNVAQKCSTPFQDIYGNVVYADFITGIDIQYKPKCSIEVSSEIGFENTKPTWQLSEDKKTYKKQFNFCGIYTTLFKMQNDDIVSITLDLK